MTVTPIEVTGQARWGVFAAVSADGQWDYREVAGSLWSVTHVATGRRCWVTGLDQARRDTGDGTAADRLEIGHQPRPGKPMVQGEYRAIRGELSARDLAAMLDQVRPRAGQVVAEVLTRFGLPGDYLGRRTVAPFRAGQILGAVYGAHPDVWLAALAAVRPDLVPPHLSHQPA